MDLSEAPGNRNLAGVLRRCRRWDYSVSANAFSTLVWERVYPTRYTSLETGYPRNDVLAGATNADAERIRGELGIEPARPSCCTRRRIGSTRTTPRRRWISHASPTASAPDHIVMARLHYFHDAHPLLRELHDTGRIRDVAGIRRWRSSASPRTSS